MVSKQNEQERDTYQNYILDGFKKRYKSICLTGKYGNGESFDYNCFVYKNEVFFLTAYKHPEDSWAFFLQYADEMRLAKLGVFPDDGDWFYASDMTKEQMLQSMIEEIEG